MEFPRHFGHQRQGNVARRLAEAVKPYGCVEPGNIRLAHPVTAQLRQPRIKPRPCADRADINRIRYQRCRQRALVILAVVGKHGDGRPAVDADRDQRLGCSNAVIGNAVEGWLIGAARCNQCHFHPRLHGHGRSGERGAILADQHQSRSGLEQLGIAGAVPRERGCIPASHRAAGRSVTRPQHRSA